MKSKTRKGYLFGILSIGLIIIILLGGWLYARSRLSLASLIQPSPVVVDVLSPGDGSQVNLHAPVAVIVQAFGASPLTTLELWVDGNSLGQYYPPSGSNGVQISSWTWQSTSPGVHMVVARAVDDQGRTGQSSPVVLNVIDDLPSSVTAINGQTLAAIAAQYGFGTQQIADANPGVDPTSPLPPGQNVQLPPPDANSSEAQDGSGSPGGDAQTPSAAPDPILLWLKYHLITPPAYPVAPALAIGADSAGCSTNLYITPANGVQDGFNIYRWRAGDTAFIRIATLGPTNGSLPILFMDQDSVGASVAAQYYIGAFNASGEALSAIVNRPPNPCIPGGDQTLGGMQWIFQSSQPVDQAYCYQSFGDGNWQRLPADPFTFWPQGQYTQVIRTASLQHTQMTLQMECWGWEGGTLQYLGKGQTQFDSQMPAQTFQVAGDNFQLIGTPQMKPMGGGGSPPPSNAAVPSPFALRLATSEADCEAHAGGGFSASLLCNAFMGSNVQSYQVVVWEWQPKQNFPCLPGSNCVTWVDHVDGYYISGSNGPTVKVVQNQDNKWAAFPLSYWTGQSDCYTIQAFVNGPWGELDSQDKTSYCLDQPPQPQTLTLDPTDWMTFVRSVIWNNDNCSLLGLSDSPGDGELLPGVQELNLSDCGMHYISTGALKFGLSTDEYATLSQGAVVKATLKFVLNDTYYAVVFPPSIGLGQVNEKTTYVAGNMKPFCPVNLGVSNSNWTLLSNSDHLVLTNSPALDIPPDMTAYTSIVGLYGASVDVTSVLKGWLNNQPNNGFLIYPDWSRMSTVFYQGTKNQACLDHLGGAVLEVQYYPPAGQ
jgi:LysM repeat protein